MQHCTKEYPLFLVMDRRLKYGCNFEDRYLLNYRYLKLMHKTEVCYTLTLEFQNFLVCFKLEGARKTINLCL